MIAALLAWQVATAVEATVTYRHVSPAVSEISAYALDDGGRPVEVSARVARDSGAAQIGGPAGRRLLIVFTRPDGAYLIDGPFSAGPGGQERMVPIVWRRTASIRAPADMDNSAELTWLPADSSTADDWPRCFFAAARLVECWGIPLSARAVVLSAQPGRTWWTLVTGPTAREFQPSAWGRLIRLNNGSSSDTLSVTVAQAVASSQRTAAKRLQTAAVTSVGVIPVVPHAVWLHGEDIVPGAWVEARTARAGPTYLSLDEVARAPSALPLWIALHESRAIDGIVRGALGEPASSALVTVFRLVGRPSIGVSGDQAKARGVAVMEQVADASGEFHLEGLGEADYEIVAWHPELGRAVATLPTGTGSVVLRLEAPGHVRGRVLAAGKPLAGVDVFSLPDPSAFAAAEDITDVKGGDARTAADGRFSVVLAPGGGGELRIGGGAFPIRRIPLPRAPLPMLELGDIDLGTPIEVSIALDQDPGCDLRATGPIGRSGLQVINGIRTAPGLFRMVFPEEGTWEVHLACGRDERALVPGVVAITPGHAGKEVRLAVR
jgi:hypothetical protein